MFSGLSHCFSFIAHLMAHKLIPKRDLPDDFHPTRAHVREKEAQRGKETEEKTETQRQTSKGHEERLFAALEESHGWERGKKTSSSF